jgi:hypothetical protein
MHYAREEFTTRAVIDTDALRFIKPLPKGMAAMLTDYDKAMTAAEEAASLREDAEAAIEDAELADITALRAALLAGQDDPGTAATQAAHRAAIVAQERLRIALADLNRAEDKIWTAAKANGEALLAAAAEAEIRRLDAVNAQMVAVFEALGRVQSVAQSVGSSYAEAAYFLPTRDEAALLNPNWPAFADIADGARQVKGWYEFRLKGIKESPAGSLS